MWELRVDLADPRAMSWRGSHTPGSARSLPARLEPRLPLTLPGPASGYRAWLGVTGASPAPGLLLDILSPGAAYPALGVLEWDPSRGSAKCQESFGVAGGI